MVINIRFEELIYYSAKICYALYAKYSGTVDRVLRGMTMKMIAKMWKQNKGFILFIFLMLFFRSAIADWYHVPTGSMQPTILIGDRVFVNKLAYDVKVPFTEINLDRRSEPHRGDVIVFDSEVSNDRLIKRVIGIPGDIIELRNNRLFVNQNPVYVQSIEFPSDFDHFLNDRKSAAYYHESLERDHSIKASHSIRILFDQHSRLSSFSPILVPEDSYWVMGDNRDNSADSRVIGVVPRRELIGRAESVIISFDKTNYYLPRQGRYKVEL